MDKTNDTLYNTVPDGISLLHRSLKTSKHTSYASEKEADVGIDVTRSPRRDNPCSSPLRCISLFRGFARDQTCSFAAYLTSYWG